jgi:predicted RNase H-like nuclease (RuvC/YqgF family)
MIRDLDTPQKADVRSILEDYLKRSTTGSQAISTAIEQLIREFNENERRNKEYSTRMHNVVTNLEARNRDLSAEINQLRSAHENLKSALKGILND